MPVDRVVSELVLETYAGFAGKGLVSVTIMSQAIKALKWRSLAVWQNCSLCIQHTLAETCVWREYYIPLLRCIILVPWSTKLSQQSWHFLACVCCISEYNFVTNCISVQFWIETSQQFHLLQKVVCECDLSFFPSEDRDCQNSGQASPCTSEQSPSPQSPQNSCSGKPATDPNMAAFKNRRMKHISEQKRRFNIKIGFSTLNSLVSTNSKSISHAIMLQKTVEYIAKLQQERTQMQEETRRLREEIEELNAAIISCQQQLPATGAPVTRQRFDHMRRMFDEYVRSRTLQNWKFWIFSIIIKPLFESFNGMVSSTSFKDLNQTAMAWVDQHCSLPVLRPMVLNTLRHLSTTTSVLSDPSRLPEQAAEAVNKMNKTAGET